MSQQRIIFSAAGRSSTPAPADSNFEYVQQLLENGTTNGQTNTSFIDSGPNAFTVTPVGDVTQGSLTPMFGSGYYSLCYTSTTSDRQYANFSTISIGTSQSFCIEAWIWIRDIWQSAESTIVGGPNDNVGTAANVQVNVANNNTFSFYFGGTSASNSTAVSRGTWVHVAAVRNSGQVRLYINGVGGTSVASSTSGQIAYIGCVGRVTSGTTTFQKLFLGYISNVRIVVGSPVYTGNFTPPSQPLAAIANTQLLTAQNSYYKDTSTNNFTIVPGGQISIARFSPFQPTQAYNSATYGGSAWFDGTGDYLTLPDNTAAIQFGSGNFTVEFWVYMPTSTNPGRIVNNWSSSTPTAASWEILSAGASIQFNCSTNGTSNTVSLNGSANLRAWNHVAGVRNGNVFTLYINGISTATTTQSITLQTANTFTIGSRRNGASYTEAFAGFVSNLRIVKGTAIYTGNFTPPTTPVTSVSGTSLLLNFSNAGVYDAAGASTHWLSGPVTSTAVAKFGTTSVRFNGTGSGIAVSTSNSAVYLIGPANFTIEMWLYALSNNTTQALFDFRPSLTDGLYPMLYIDNTGKLIYWISATARITSGSSITTGQWYHVALTRSGTSTKLFLDGVQTGSTYIDSNIYLVSSTRIIIGASAYNVGTLQLNGYMQDFRITNGVARYTANFTPPSATFPTY